MEFPRTLWEQLEDEFTDEIEFIGNYSGRSMYGDTCIGIVGGHNALVKFIARIATWNYDGEEDAPRGEDICEELSYSVVTDALGEDMVFYFPGVKLGSE